MLSGKNTEDATAGAARILFLFVCGRTTLWRYLMNNEMKKNMGLMAAMAAVIGGVIGSGIFFKPQAMYTLTGGAPGIAMVAWIVTGLVCIFAAMTFAEIAILIPETGGIAIYLEKVFGKKVGFLAGWMQILLFYPAMISALAVATAQQATVFVSPRLLVPIAIMVVVVIALLNMLGSAVGSWVQIISTIGKLIPIFLLIALGFAKGEQTGGVFSPMIGEELNPITVMGQLMIAVLFAFEGWTNVGAIAGEMKKPARDLPLAIIGGVSIITAIYLVINIAYLQVLPADQLKDLAAPASAVAEVIFGSKGGAFIAVGIMVSTFGACNAFVLGGSRIVYMLAGDGDLPFSRFFGKLSSRQVPANGIIFVSTIGALYAVSGQFNMLTDLAVFSSWTFYTLTFASVMRYRKTAPDLERTYKVPLYPVIPIISILSGVFVLVNQLLFSGPAARWLSIGSIVVTLLGLPVYLIMQKRKEAQGSVKLSVVEADHD